MCINIKYMFILMKWFKEYYNLIYIIILNMDIILLYSYFFRFVSWIDDMGLFCGLLRLILMVIILYVYFYICICSIIELMK